jgi:hypothetical protein
VYQWLKTRFGLLIWFINHLQVVTTINFHTIADLHITKHATPISSVYLHQSSRIYDTGTIKVSLYHTLPISLCYSTHNVFKSRVKSSQADLLYSSVLHQLADTLQPLTAILVCVLLPLLLQLRNSAHLYSRGTDMDHRKCVSRDHYPTSLLAHVARTYSKHMSRDRYLLLCNVTADTDCVYRAVTWQRIDLIRYSILRPITSPMDYYLVEEFYLLGSSPM